jgi:hypothetical protein
MSIFLVYAHNACVLLYTQNATRFENFIRSSEGSPVHTYFLSEDNVDDQFAMVVSNLKAAYEHMETLSRRRSYEHFNIHL